MSKLKENLISQLFKHLDTHLDPSTKAGLTSQQTHEILQCVVEWVYKDEAILARVRKAKAVKEAIKTKRTKRETKVPNDQAEQSTAPEFMDELDKI